MYDQNAGADSQAVSRFWHNYLSILEKASVRERAGRWYRIRSEGYIPGDVTSGTGACAPQRRDDDIDAKGRMAELREWRMRQLTDGAQSGFLLNLFDLRRRQVLIRGVNSGF